MAIFVHKILLKLFFSIKFRKLAEYKNRFLKLLYKEHILSKALYALPKKKYFSSTELFVDQANQLFV